METTRPAKVKHQIKLRDTGEQFVCGEDEFILAAMRRTGKGPIHCGCYGGGCGVCKMRVISGPWEAVKRMSREHVTQEEQDLGIVLTCCVQPRGNVVIASIEAE